MIDLALTLALVLFLLLSFRLLFVTLPGLWVSARRCPRCRHRFGTKAVFAAIPYSERLGGTGMRVMGGPRRYRGASVTTCSGCGSEFVFGEFGNLVEPFQHHTPLLSD